MHLGRYPMEKLRRVDRPTTLITENVKQVPKRAGFFVRAFYGDLGPKPAREIRRFITKNPLNAAIGHLHWKHVPRSQGRSGGREGAAPQRRGRAYETHQVALLLPRRRHGRGLRGARICLVLARERRHADRDPAQIRRRHRDRPGLGHVRSVVRRRLGLGRAELSRLSERLHHRDHRRRLYPPPRISRPGALERPWRRDADSADAALPGSAR